MNDHAQEILKLLGQQHLRKATEDGFTSVELAEWINRHHCTAQRIIRELVRAGRLEIAGERRKVALDGRMLPATCYRIVATVDPKAAPCQKSKSRKSVSASLASIARLASAGTTG